MTACLLGLWFTLGQLQAEKTVPNPSGGKLHAIAPRTPQELQELLKYNGEAVCLVGAHRGGAQKGYPENCLATFEYTLRHTFSMMEIDPRYTKDGAIVLMHDPSVDRTTTGKGAVAEMTLQELKQLRLKDREGNPTDYQIPTLDEALEWARGKTILVLDQKDVAPTNRVKKITEHKAESYAMLIVPNFKEAQACYALNSNVMMEVMIPTLEKAKEFDKLGVPWRNVIAFVGHTAPQEAELYKFIHEKGACCMVGSSRNFDRQFLTGKVTDIRQLESNYRTLLQNGADIIETDIPRELGPLLYGTTPVPASRAKYLQRP